MACTEGISGSMVAVMKPQAKNSVVTAMNAARQSLLTSSPANGVSLLCFSAIAPFAKLKRLAPARAMCQREVPLVNCKLPSDSAGRAPGL